MNNKRKMKKKIFYLKWTLQVHHEVVQIEIKGVGETPPAAFCSREPWRRRRKVEGCRESCCFLMHTIPAW
jgi:hypothetical protein